MGPSPDTELEVRVHLHGSRLSVCAPLAQKSVSKAHSPFHWAHLHTKPAGPQEVPSKGCSVSDFGISGRTQ